MNKNILMMIAVLSLTALHCVARPNILFAISDDQSWPHAGAYGCKFVKTPAFDRIAKEGILFNNGFCAAPQCSPTRASILTGRNIWQNEEAGTHASWFPTKLKVYTEILQSAGYHVGYTGKGWAPGKVEPNGRKNNPAGNRYTVKYKTPMPATGINKTDYAAGFEKFMEDRKEGQPFCFWYGAFEPHRSFEYGSGAKSGKNLESVKPPEFLPDDALIRNDLLDYALEIEWFDKHLARIIAKLEVMGELDNTLIVVTSDNGMSFPRAKANLYEYGIHMPMAARWGKGIKNPGREINDFVNHIDLAPTFLDAAGVSVPDDMTGRSMLNLFESEKSGWIDPQRDYTLSGRERHTHARPDNQGYPARSIRTRDFLYIRNFKPERWPAGDPAPYPFMDIDDCPSKTFMQDSKSDEITALQQLAVARRPAEELYFIVKDSQTMKNVAGNPEYALAKQELSKRLDKLLRSQGDPRALGYGDIFDSYPRLSPMRKDFDGWTENKYNPKYQKLAEEARRKAGLK
ncbi:MAG: sulfatase [Kiritimatiellae bacterium]|jgi:N-sulfoglucosamine sulfohydrolase|nr:sulfatase [Kiritimatiellia bacterium]